MKLSQTQLLEATAFHYKQKVAKLKHELLAKDDIITCLKQDIVDVLDENEELRKDKQRLDWLVGNASISMIHKDEDGEEWWVELAYSEPREDIDQAMEGAQ